MEMAKLELVAAWLAKAESDLASARKLACPPETLLDTAVYHCQQAAEKVLKGFLVYHDQEFERTHDITDLIRAALPYAPDFAPWLGAGELLTPLATRFRYPAGASDPEMAEFRSALQAAEGICEFVRSHLPPLQEPRHSCG
jgi:HEPN domain-containing protein